MNHPCLARVVCGVLLVLVLGRPVSAQTPTTCLAQWSAIAASISDLQGKVVSTKIAPITRAMIAFVTARCVATPTPPTVVDSITVTTAAQLQAALNGSTLTVVVAPGTYVGNFTVPKKATKTTVRGLTFAGRATRTLAYPKLVAQDISASVLSVQLGAHDVTLVGLEFTGVAPDRNVIEVGVGATALDHLPKNITFAQVWVHGTTPPFGHRGLYFDAVNGTVRDSLFTDFVEQGRDSNAIGIFGGAGPYLIENNWLEASGEGMMIGGSDPAIVGLIPSDIIVRGNTFVKPLSWRKTYRYPDGTTGHDWTDTAVLVSGYPGSVKNMFELKNANNVTITNNLFENVWADAQSGSAILFTVRNQDGGCPWCTITNVLFECNTIRNAPNAAFSILGTDNNHPSGTADNIRILNNLATGVGNGIALDGGTNVEIAGNVLVGIAGKFMGFSGHPTTGFRYTGNFSGSGDYGLFGDAIGVGIIALTHYAPAAVFTGNTIETTPVRDIGYPAGNTLVPPGSVTAGSWLCR